MYLLIKSSVDKIGAILLLGILFPLFVLVFIGIRFCMGPNVIFTQERAGKNGYPFKIYKFRTMSNAKDSNGNLLPDEQRQTPLGNWIRRFSLDELPQIINILKGEMSFIGPRALLISYLPHYTPTQNRRHNVLPGITGLAQVKGRNRISWEKKFEYDIYYVDHLSLWLDIYIVFLTFIEIFFSKGVTTESNQTSAPFGPNGGQKSAI